MTSSENTFIPKKSTQVLYEIYTSEASFLAKINRLDEHINTLLKVDVSKLGHDKKLILLQLQSAIRSIISSPALKTFMDKVATVKKDSPTKIMSFIEINSTKLINALANDIAQSYEYYLASSSCANIYNVFKEIVDELNESSNRDVVDALTKINRNEEQTRTYQDLQSLAIEPIQRPPRYEILLQQLIKAENQQEIQHMLGTTITNVNARNSKVNSGVSKAAGTTELLKERKRFVIEFLIAEAQCEIAALLTALREANHNDLTDIIKNISNISLDPNIEMVKKFDQINKALINTPAVLKDVKTGFQKKADGMKQIFANPISVPLKPLSELKALSKEFDDHIKRINSADTKKNRRELVNILTSAKKLFKLEKERRDMVVTKADKESDFINMKLKEYESKLKNIMPISKKEAKKAAEKFAPVKRKKDQEKRIPVGRLFESERVNTSRSSSLKQKHSGGKKGSKWRSSY
jgi:hypothetical protein